MTQRPTVDVASTRSVTTQLPETYSVNSAPVTTSRSETTQLPAGYSSGAPTVELHYPAAPEPTMISELATRSSPVGAYSITPRKLRAISESELSHGAVAGCELVEILDGGMKLRVNGQPLKLSTAVARELVDLILRALR